MIKEIKNPRPTHINIDGIIMHWSDDHLRSMFDDLDKAFSSGQSDKVLRIIKKICQRSRYLNSVLGGSKAGDE